MVVLAHSVAYRNHRWSRFVYQHILRLRLWGKLQLSACMHMRCGTLNRQAPVVTQVVHRVLYAWRCAVRARIHSARALLSLGRAACSFTHPPLQLHSTHLRFTQQAPPNKLLCLVRPLCSSPPALSPSPCRRPCRELEAAATHLTAATNATTDLPQPYHCPAAAAEVAKDDRGAHKPSPDAHADAARRLRRMVTCPSGSTAG